MNALPSSPACLRNREPILAALRPLLHDRSHVLEIGSGTGEHAVYFSRALPHLQWQTSDVAAHHGTIAARIAAEGAPNCLPPAAFDVSLNQWPHGDFDAVFTANTCHIMSWDEVGSMFAMFDQHLPAGAPVCVYGPFHYGGKPTSASNAAFDASLRERAPHMGIRDFADMAALARAANLTLEHDIEMPANNRLLVWRRSVRGLA
jgi:cyclopropane fatty-acyl-phospholipid synthase-like methyltransferase